MVKNLQVNFSNGFKFKKGVIHQLIIFLKNELKFDVSSLFINFISSNNLLEINKIFLSHNYYTDIITFNYSRSKNLLDGELLISFEEANLNAKKFGVTKKDEYFRLVIHGILHLLDYDDQNKNTKLVMKRLENNLLKKFNYRLKIKKN